MIVEIDPKSWHYRLIDHVSSEKVPTNFCPYMRKLSAFIILYAFLFPSLAYGAIEFFTLLIMGKEWIKEVWLNGILLDFGGLTLSIHGFMSLIAGGVATGFGFVVLAIAGIETVVEHYRSTSSARKYAERQAEGYVPPGPSIFTQWMQALHEKTCPIIEFKSKDDA